MLFRSLQRFYQLLTRLPLDVRSHVILEHRLKNFLGQGLSLRIRVSQQLLDFVLPELKAVRQHLRQHQQFHKRQGTLWHTQLLGSDEGAVPQTLQKLYHLKCNLIL